ncbi:MAG: hypothetical protein IJI44_05935, partial [Erysipelotrichaceae bacterium]|nr:hypothetical protein [Erysipelotrichaceae bacterium]
TYLCKHLANIKDHLKSRMRENRMYGSVRGGASNGVRLLDSDMSAISDFRKAVLKTAFFCSAFWKQKR